MINIPQFLQVAGAKVVAAETQVVAGIRYKLSLQTVGGSVATLDIVRELDTSIHGVLRLEGQVVEVHVPVSRAPKF